MTTLQQLIKKDPKAAVQQLRERLGQQPFDAQAYRHLAEALKSLGEVRVSVAESHMMRAAHALHAGDLETAEIILRRHLLEKPRDADALRMMAALARMLGYEVEEEQLLRLALEVRPEFNAALYDLAVSLDRQKRHAQSVELLDQLLERTPNDTRVLYFKGTQLTRSARFEEGAEQFAQLVRLAPEKPEFWTSYGHVLKTLGRRAEAIAAFRKAITIAPTMGVIWWSLSEFKTFQFSSSDIDQMLAALDVENISNADRFHLHFALGKAFEDAGDAERAFEHYHEGNRLRRADLPDDRRELGSYVSAAARAFTTDFFRERSGWGDASPDPIFILGMTRAGSTLIEQILSSHPLIEGTMELPELPQLAKQVSRSMAEYAVRLAEMSKKELLEIGRAYLDRTKEYRKTDRPNFVDKMPNNWMHVPLIHLALPNARIIDARRHPLACCFSNFKQHFAMGQTFSYDLRELGRYYSDYVRLMAHIDEVLPDRVYRVFHEELVQDSERVIRGLLEHLELPFDEACLRFYETKRAVRSASSDQVRQPIRRESVDSWRVFEPWLGTLKEALGPVLNAYPDVPDFPE